MTDSTNSLPLVIDPDDPSRKKPFSEMTGLMLWLTPEEFSAVEALALRSRMSVGELSLRALAYGLTVLETSQQQVERRQPKANWASH